MAKDDKPDRDKKPKKAKGVPEVEYVLVSECRVSARLSSRTLR